MFKDEREGKDPYYTMMKPEPTKDISSRYDNEWDIDDLDFHKMEDETEKNIGRYPIGFRYLENYENYKALKKDATI